MFVKFNFSAKDDGFASKKLSRIKMNGKQLIS
jgi:hypothetical protein